jgi:outer membrane protein
MTARIIVWAAVVALATASPPPAGALDLQECITLALAHDPGLRADELESAAANARLKEMQGQYVPSVSLQAGYSRLSEVPPGTLGPMTLPAAPLNSTIVRLLVQQPLFTGLRIASSIRQADAVRLSAGSDAARSRLDLRSAVADSFWQLARARAQEKSLIEGRGQMERRLADVKTLVQQGVATDNDVLQASLRLEDARIEVARAAGAREIAWVRLAQLIGVPLAPAMDIDGADAAGAPEPAPGVAGGLEDVVSRALASRPEIAGARSRVGAQEAAIDLARAGLYPTVFLTGDYTLADPNPRVFPAEDKFTGSWSVGIMASFDVGRYPQVAAQEEQAKTRAAQARENARRLSDAVAAEVVRAALSLNTALQVYASMKEETVQAEENLRYVQERRRQGVALESATLDAQTVLERARLREQAGLYDCLIARVSYERAVGE